MIILLWDLLRLCGWLAFPYGVLGMKVGLRLTLRWCLGTRCYRRRGSILAMLRRPVDGSKLSRLGVCVQVITTNAHDRALRFTRVYPLRHHDRNVHLYSLLPQRAPSLRADKVRRVDADGVDQLTPNPVQCCSQGLPLLFRDNSGRDCDSGQICHLVRTAGQLLRLVGASGST